MSQVAALARMRFAGYARSQRVLAPVLATLALMAIFYNGSSAPAYEAYGVSAVALFGILGWQAKLALDTEPDAQRQLSYLAVGSARREVAAGLLAAAATAVPTIVVGIVGPAVAGAVNFGESPAKAVAVGLWLHVLAAVPAVAVGAWASRPVTRTRGWGVATLVGITVVVLVLGVTHVTGLQWLVPQLTGAIRAGQRGDIGSGIVISVHAVVWSALFFVAYIGVRNRRR